MEKNESIINVLYINAQINSVGFWLWCLTQEQTGMGNWPVMLQVLSSQVYSSSDPTSWRKKPNSLI